MALPETFTVHSTESLEAMPTPFISLNYEVATNISADVRNTMYLGKANLECLRLPNASFLSRMNTDTAVVSHTTEKMMYQALQLVASTIICIVGIPTNFINVIVFLKMGLKDRVNLCLFWLSSCDMMSLVTHILRSGELTVQFYSGDTLRMYRSDMAKVLYDYGLGTITGFRQISFFMYALIALDRCLCVLMPLRIRQLITNRLITTVVILGSVVSFILNIFSVLSHGTLCVVFLDTGIRGYLIGTSKLVQQHPQFLRLSTILDGFVMGLALPILFLSTVIISTTITAVTLSRRKDWLHQVTFSSSTDAATPRKPGRTSGGGRGQGSGQEVAITRMLVTVSSVYVFCTVPFFLHRLVRFLVPGFMIGHKYNNIYMVTYHVNSVLVNINAAVNFLVFYWQGTRFRKQVQHLFYTACCRAHTLQKVNGESSLQHSNVTQISTTRGIPFATSFKTRENEATH